MIENAKKSKKVDEIRVGKKDYYLITVNHKQEGISTKWEGAKLCADAIMKRDGAIMVEGKEYYGEIAVYLYQTKSGWNTVMVEKIRRIKTPNIPTDK